MAESNTKAALAAGFSLLGDEKKIMIHLEPTSDLNFVGKDDKGNKAEVPMQYERKGNEPLAKFQHALRKVLIKYKILAPDESIV